MRKSIKKKLAIPLILIILVVYAYLVTRLYTVWHDFMPAWLETGFFALFGMGWALPAALAIKWIEKDPKTQQTGAQLNNKNGSKIHSVEKNHTPDA